MTQGGKGRSVKQTVKFIEQLLLGSCLRNMWRTNEMFVSTDGFACRRAGNLTPGTFSLTPSSNPAAVSGFCGEATIWCKRMNINTTVVQAPPCFLFISSLFSLSQERLGAVMRCCSVLRRYHLPHYYFKSSDNSSVSDVILMHMEGVPVTWFPGFEEKVTRPLTK